MQSGAAVPDRPLFRRLSSAATPPACTSALREHDFGQKVAFADDSTPGLGPHCDPDNSADATPATDWRAGQDAQADPRMSGDTFTCG